MKQEMFKDGEAKSVLFESRELVQWQKQELDEGHGYSLNNSCGTNTQEN